jgi:type 1 glutamine amidotransferase
VQVNQQGNTALRYWAIDTAGNYSVGDPATAPAPAGGPGGGRGPAGAGGRGAAAPAGRGAAAPAGRGAPAARGGGGGGGRGGAGPTTLSAAAAAGATGIHLSSTDGRVAGENLVLGTGANQELVTIDHVVPDISPDSPAPNVMLQTPLKKDHSNMSQNGVFTTYRTVAVLIDSMPPVAAWPVVLDGKVMQSQTLTPALSDPRRQSPNDTANGSGGTAIWRMEIDGKHVFPFPQVLNQFTIGKHSQMVALQDVAGNAINYTLTFDVTTSFDDLDAVLTQYTSNAWSTTVATPAAAGDTGLRLTAPLGYRAGQTLLVGTGSSQETVKIASIPSPPPPQTGANIILATPLKQAHDAGDATPVSNPRPYISDATAAKLHELLKQASNKASAGQKPAAIAALKQFNAAVTAQVIPATEKVSVRAALTSAGQALIDQVGDKRAEVAGLGVTTAPGTSIIRIFTDPTPPVHNPKATYKILVNGHAGSFRHEHVVDTEAMIQKLGADNDFDVDIWDPPGTVAPGRQIPLGVSLTTSPFLDLNTLKQYKTIVFDSTVGRDPSGSLNPTEFAIFKQYIEQGGGFIAIHGGIDAYQDIPWYTDLDGGGFSGHGGNAQGIVPDCMSCGEVEVIKADPSHPATIDLQPRFALHDELYNTNRNPVELDIVHPLVLENESTLIGEINVTTGPLMNSDRHGLVWCRNFDGGRSLTTVLGHNWMLSHDKWYQQMVLGAIQSTSGVVPSNCSTYIEAIDLLAAGVASGGVSAAANIALSAPLAKAKAEYDKGAFGSNAKQAFVHANEFVAETEKQQAICKSSPKACSDGGAAIAKLHAEGVQLASWMKALSR